MCLKTLLIFAVTGASLGMENRVFAGQGIYRSQNCNIDQYLISPTPLVTITFFCPRADAIYLKHNFFIQFYA
jgi:hypothetical protein